MVITLCSMCCIALQAQNNTQWRFVQKFNNGEEHYVSESFEKNSKGNYLIKLKRIFPKKYHDEYVKKYHINIETYEVTSDLVYYGCIFKAWYDNDGNLTESRRQSGVFDYLPKRKPTIGLQFGWSMKEIIMAHNGEQISRNASSVQSNDIYTDVDVAASFPGGQSGLTRWLISNLRYPEKAAYNNEQGRVLVKFVVNTDGSIESPQIINSVSKLLDEEALRLVRIMPKWNPAYKDGSPCRCYFTLPLSFRIQ